MTFDERIVAISTARKRMLAIGSERIKLIEAWNRALTVFGVDTSSERILQSGRPLGVPATHHDVSSVDLNAMAVAIGTINSQLASAQQEWAQLTKDYTEAMKKIGAI